MEANFEDSYHSLEQKHFWFKSRRDYITNLLKDCPRDIKILDIGSSSGILLTELENLGFKNKNLYGIDISENAIKNCKENGICNAFVMDAESISINEKFDVIIASDCLEHLENDTKALHNWNKLLKPNGLLLVFVPAFMFLWSGHDDANMHYRRYTRAELTQKLLQQNYKIKQSGYWNFLLFLPISVLRILNRLKPSGNSQKNHDLVNLPLGNQFLFHLLNFENRLLKKFRFPFGVSTFCIATKSSK